MWQIVDIAEPRRTLALDRNALVVRSAGETLGSVPLSDIQAVIVHGHGATISLNLSAALAEAGIPLVQCGSDHMPRALTLPVTGNFEMAVRVQAQAEASLPLQKRMWQQIVRAKVRAQSVALRLAGHADHEAVGRYVAKVRSGDPDNIEAQAARYYWPRMLGTDFRRNVDGAGLNRPLNYGYTILRSAVARAIVAAGLTPALGVHHRNRRNPYQLVDDLMEPFRPLVDQRVRRNAVAWGDDLSAAGKALLADIVNAEVLTPDGTMALHQALARYAYSAAETFLRDRRELWLPAEIAEVRQAELALDGDA